MSLVSSSQQGLPMGPTIATLGYPLTPVTFHLYKTNNPAKYPNSPFVQFYQSEIDQNCLRTFQILCLTSLPKKFAIDLDFCSPLSKAQFKVLFYNEGVSDFLTDMNNPEKSLYGFTLKTTDKPTFLKILNYIIRNNMFDEKAQEALDEGLKRAGIDHLS